MWYRYQQYQRAVKFFVKFSLGHLRIHAIAAAQGWFQLGGLAQLLVPPFNCFGAATFTTPNFFMVAATGINVFNADVVFKILTTIFNKNPTVVLPFHIVLLPLPWRSTANVRAVYGGCAPVRVTIIRWWPAQRHTQAAVRPFSRGFHNASFHLVGHHAMQPGHY